MLLGPPMPSEFDSLLDDPFRPMQDEEWEDLEGQVRQLFRPRAPIDDVALFAGRQSQANELIDVVYEDGAHAIIHGERGVGKTSLVNTIRQRIFGPAKHTTVLRVACNPSDTFTSIWSNVFYDYEIDGKRVSEVVELNPRPFTVFKIAENLGTKSKDRRFYLVILDEFDRVRDENTKVLVADTIKYLSDNPVNFTIVVVGVGKSREELFGSHPSIQRCCIQIRMPRMLPGELVQILNEHLPRVGMEIDPMVAARMVQYSQGLPGYMHLLGQLSALQAIENRSLTITFEHLAVAVRRAIGVADESLRHEYHRAIRSTKPDNRYREVLLACALAKKNELGQFRAQDVTEPYSQIVGRPMKFEDFARHLNAFREPIRGPVLVREGVQRGYLYQFANPLLEPLVVMNGVGDDSSPTLSQPERDPSTEQ